MFFQIFSPCALLCGEEDVDEQNPIRGRHERKEHGDRRHGHKSSNKQQKIQINLTVNEVASHDKRARSKGRETNGPMEVTTTEEGRNTSRGSVKDASRGGSMNVETDEKGATTFFTPAGGRVKVMTNDEGGGTIYTPGGGIVKFRTNEKGEVEVSAGEAKKIRSGKKRTGKARRFKWWWKDDVTDDEEDEGEEDDDDVDDENEGKNGLPQDKPLVRVWVRLLVVTVFAIFVTGLLPGQALFIRMLSDYGLYKSVCEEGENTCVKQELSVASVFNLVQACASLSMLPAGYLFDRFGGRWTSCVGGGCSFFGLLLLEVPLLGIKYGRDDLTSRVFPLAIICTDIGNMFSQYSVLSLVYHFPKSQTLLFSLIIVQQASCALLPNVLSYVQQQFQLDLPVVFGLFSLLTLGAVIGLAFTVPTKTEYIKEAEKVMGRAMPQNSKGLLSDIKKNWRIMRVYWFDHACFGAAMTTFFTLGILYGSFVGAYAEMLWGSQKAGDDLAALFTTLTGTLGTACTLIVSWVADRAGNSAIFVVAAIFAVGLVLITTNVMGPTYDQQVACEICVVVLQCLSIPLSMRYCVAYTPASQLGSFNGVIWTLVTIGYSIELGICLGYLPSLTTAAAMGTMLMICSIIATIVFLSWAVRQYIKGLPSKPPIVAEIKDNRLAQAFL